ncbi:probable serine/threonine-protein kinase DDB_G0282963 isoform X2 [Manduca sexta]|uniref:probable serine/threonine-protein kinase DDB_G0282963 isoform X2 n=1 Tax=Manduca sexta TaxID=7130 RepID=UPI00188E8423|nr:probable serine/threonine-protein kinase DDB_G0282963 isoform X2 [Manduca sexta]
MEGRGLIFSLLIGVIFMVAYTTAKSTYPKKDALKEVAEKKTSYLRLKKEETMGDIESDSDNNSKNDPESNSKNGSENSKNESNYSKNDSDNNAKTTVGQTSDSVEQNTESNEINQGSDASDQEEENDLNQSKNNKETDENDSSNNDPDSDTPRFQLKEEKRSVMAGDTFTPSEMLPIAKKLLSKVENPGEGKGIVSSAKNSQELSDRLFEAFFLTHKRIVTLKDFDISGLDALQALALSGEPANLRTASESVTATPKYRILNFEGQYVGVDTKPRQCHYRLITKKDNTGRTKPNKNKRRQVIDLASRLAKKRRLVVKAGLRDEKIKNANKSPKDIGQQKKRVKIRSKQKPNIVYLKKSKTNVLRSNQNKYNADSLKGIKNNDISNTSTPACRWQYKCQDMSNLDTCRLHTKCKQEVNKPANNLVGDNHNEEYTLALKRFRKMLRISDVDEEVEKILENRIINLRPPHMRVERIETLAEYFNKIIISEFQRTTTPLPPSIVDLLAEANTESVPQDMVAKIYENGADDENKERKRRRLSNTRTTPLAP